MFRNPLGRLTRMGDDEPAYLRLGDTALSIILQDCGLILVSFTPWPSIANVLLAYRHKAL